MSSLGDDCTNNTSSYDIMYSCSYSYGYDLRCCYDYKGPDYNKRLCVSTYVNSYNYSYCNKKFDFGSYYMIYIFISVVSFLWLVSLTKCCSTISKTSKFNKNNKSQRQKANLLPTVPQEQAPQMVPHQMPQQYGLPPPQNYAPPATDLA